MEMRYVWMATWLGFYLLGFKMNCVEALGNKGIHVIGNEYYRFFTGLLLHVNLFHLLINMVALYWVGDFLKGQVGELKLLCFSAVAALLANVVFSFLYPECSSIGGSPVVFSLIGLIFILQLMRKDLPRLQLHSVHGSWIIGVAVLGNIPVFSKNISTLVIHMLALAAAMAMGFVGIKIGIF